MSLILFQKVNMTSYYHQNNGQHHPYVKTVVSRKKYVDFIYQFVKDSRTTTEYNENNNC